MCQKALWIFLILLAALILSSFLGNMVEEGFVVASDTSGNTTNYVSHSPAGTSTFNSTTDPNTGTKTYDNYNHYDGTSANTPLVNGTVFYGQNGGQVVVITGADGKINIKVILPNDPTPVVYNYADVDKWTGPNGTATLVQTGGAATIKVSLNNGQTYVYTVNQIGNTSNYTTSYYGSTGAPPPAQSDYYSYSQTGTPPPPPPPPPPNDIYNQPVAAAAVATNTNAIPASMIPPGQEDLYVLKSSIIPPVCPACPTVVNTCDKKDCPPCPAPQRCPEPMFDCKKVPNYNAVNNPYLPVPILNDFSQFGM